MPTRTFSRNQKLTVRILLINIQTQGGSEITDGVSPSDYKAQLKGCWARRVDLFLKVARDLYPQECCGITVSDIEREVQAA